jgi:hypothetical protein
MNTSSRSIADSLRGLSEQDFLAFGVQQIAYIRPVFVNGAVHFSIHAADGTPLAIHHDVRVAAALTRQNNLEPMYLH